MLGGGGVEAVVELHRTPDAEVAVALERAGLRLGPPLAPAERRAWVPAATPSAAAAALQSLDWAARDVLEGHRVVRPVEPHQVTPRLAPGACRAPWDHARAGMGRLAVHLAPHARSTARLRLGSAWGGPPPGPPPCRRISDSEH